MLVPFLRGYACLAGLLIATSLALSAQDCATGTREKWLTAIRLIHLPDGLHKAAVANGGKIEIGGHTAPIDRAAGLTDFTTRSFLNAVVRVTARKTELVNDGRDLETVYTRWHLNKRSKARVL